MLQNHHVIGMIKLHLKEMREELPKLFLIKRLEDDFRNLHRLSISKKKFKDKWPITPH
jgi:hypothetical protein